jgi:hypothetical protein
MTAPKHSPDDLTVRFIATSADLLVLCPDLKGAPMYVPGLGATDKGEKPGPGYIDRPLSDAVRFGVFAGAHERAGRLKLAIVEGGKATPIKASDMAVLATA